MGYLAHVATPMNRYRDYLRSEAAYHILIWALLIIPHGFFTYPLLERFGATKYVANLLVTDGLMLVIVYLNVFYLIPKYYKARKFLTYYFILMILIGIYIYAAIALEDFIMPRTRPGQAIINAVIFNFFNIARYCVIAFLLYDIQEKFDQGKQLDQIKIEKVNTEINYLRAQINPHFLFNTLNNLYGLALEKSERTPEVILKLSKIMDYMLFELDGSKIPLEKDVENLENYIELEKIRQGNNAKIVFNKSGTIDNQLIEPLLLLPLVENAFKHGVNKMIEGAYLEIKLEVSGNAIRFEVTNNYSQSTSEKQMHSSIGLTNLRRRLELFYPKHYTLTINDDSVNYRVMLTLDTL
jgi:two-component system, LytTR family, sensor kinase